MGNFSFNLRSVGIIRCVHEASKYEDRDEVALDNSCTSTRNNRRNNILLCKPLQKVIV